MESAFTRRSVVKLVDDDEDEEDDDVADTIRVRVKGITRKYVKHAVRMVRRCAASGAAQGMHAEAQEAQDAGAVPSSAPGVRDANGEGSGGIVIVAYGKAIAKAISVAEQVKRVCAAEGMALEQSNATANDSVREVFEPRVPGLDTVAHVRRICSIRIQLRPHCMR